MGGYYVYQLRLDTAALPFYVGKGKRRRAWSHFSAKSLAVNSRKSNIIKKATRQGVAVHVEIVDSNLPEVDALALEVRLIASYGRLDIGTGCLVNLTDGGEGSSGYTHSKDAIEAMRLASTGRPVSDESKAKISLFHKGRERSKEHALNISKSKLGKPAHPNTVAGLLEAVSRSKSADHKAKIGAANKGKERDEDSKMRMREANKLKPLKSCPYCTVVTKPSAYTRYHGENCRFKS